MNNPTHVVDSHELRVELRQCARPQFECLELTQAEAHLALLLLLTHECFVLVSHLVATLEHFELEACLGHHASVGTHANTLVGVHERAADAVAIVTDFDRFLFILGVLYLCRAYAEFENSVRARSAHRGFGLFSNTPVFLILLNF